MPAFNVSVLLSHTASILVNDDKQSRQDPEYRTDKLMQQLGVSALFLGMMYFIVALLVWRGVKRVFREDTRHWSTLKVFCVALLIVPILRALAFVAHFLLYEGHIFGQKVQENPFLKDVIMNSLYMVPTFIFLFTYMVLICIWIEITMFSRDQYLIEHDRYNRLWRIIWATLLSLTISALAFCLVWTSVTQNVDLLTGLYTSLWIMTFVIPLVAFCVWLLLLLRFAGFPFLNEVWRQQTIRMFHIIAVWTLGQLLNGAMSAVWSSQEGDWMTTDDSLWFSLSVALTLVCSEMLPLLYTSDWHRMGSLLMAFVNWRDLWLRNQQHALAHDPRLIDDAYACYPASPTPHAHSSEFEFKPLTKQPRRSHYDSLGRRLLGTDTDKENEAKCSRSHDANHGNSIGARHNIAVCDLVMDTSLIIPTYAYDGVTAYSSTHCAKLRHKAVDVDDEKADEQCFCVKIFECDAVEQSMLDTVYENLLAFQQLRHDNLAAVYSVHLSAEANGSHRRKRLSIVSEWYRGGSLYDIIAMSPKDTPFATHVLRTMLLQIATFLRWLHTSCKMAHGHLKSRNILFDRHMNVCVTDVGLVPLKKTLAISMPDCNFEGYWMDKEYFEGQPITPPCDVWAFGFIVYELVSKRQPFAEANNDLQAIKKAIMSHDNMPTLPKHCPTVLAHLVQQCWSTQRAQRPTFDAIVDIVENQM